MIKQLLGNMHSELHTDWARPCDNTQYSWMNDRRSICKNRGDMHRKFKPRSRPAKPPARAKPSVPVKTAVQAKPPGPAKKFAPPITKFKKPKKSKLPTRSKSGLTRNQ